MRRLFFILVIMASMIFSQEIDENGMYSSPFGDYYQSQMQSFYFQLSQVDGISVGDWIGVYCDSVLVGSRQITNSEFYDIPVFGDEGSSLTEGYCSAGDIPYFEFYDVSTEEFHYIIASGVCGWAQNGFCNSLNIGIGGIIDNSDSGNSGDYFYLIDPQTGYIYKVFTSQAEKLQ